MTPLSVNHMSAACTVACDYLIHANTESSNKTKSANHSLFMLLVCCKATCRLQISLLSLLLPSSPSPFLSLSLPLPLPSSPSPFLSLSLPLPFSPFLSFSPFSPFSPPPPPLSPSHSLFSALSFSLFLFFFLFLRLPSSPHVPNRL